MSKKLKNLKIWDNNRYTLKEACAELEEIKGIEAKTMETKVQALIDAGTTSPIRSTQRNNPGITTLPGKKKLVCKCVNPNSRGVCVLGTCVNISQDGWSITINDIAYLRAIKSKDGLTSDKSKWPSEFRLPAPPSIYRRIKACFCNRSNKSLSQGTLSAWQIANPNLSVGLQADGMCRMKNGTLVTQISLPGGDGEYMVLQKGATNLLPIVGDYFTYDLQSASLRMLITSIPGPISFIVRDIGADITTGQLGSWRNSCPQKTPGIANDADPQFDYHGPTNLLTIKHVDGPIHRCCPVTNDPQAPSWVAVNPCGGNNIYTGAVVLGSGCGPHPNAAGGASDPNWCCTYDLLVGCFAKGDEVEMFNGTMKAIELIKIGDEVKSGRNGEMGIVTETLVHPVNDVVKVVNINGITAEPYHPVLVDNKWVPIKKLGNLSNKFIDNWYNLEIDSKTDTNFIIGDLIVSGLGNDCQKLLKDSDKRENQLAKQI